MARAVVIIILCGFLPLAAVGAYKVSRSDIHHARQYVMASCIIKKYPDQRIADEAHGWAGGILENTDFSVDQYLRLSHIGADEKTMAINKDGRIIHIQTCFEVATSAKTQKRILQILRH